MRRHIHAFVFWAGNLRSHLTRHQPTEEKVSVQTGIECVCICGFYYLYKEDNEKIEVGYPSELFK